MELPRYDREDNGASSREKSMAVSEARDYTIWNELKSRNETKVAIVSFGMVSKYEAVSTSSEPFSLMRFYQ